MAKSIYICSRNIFSIDIADKQTNIYTVLSSNGIINHGVNINNETKNAFARLVDLLKMKEISTRLMLYFLRNMFRKYIIRPRLDYNAIAFKINIICKMHELLSRDCNNNAH